MYSFDPPFFFYPCSFLSRRAVRSIPIRNLIEYPPPIAHVIIIIKSEVSTLPIVIIFSVVVCLRCLLHHILSLIAYTFQENWEFVFIINVQFMMTWKSWICSVLQIVFVCLYITASHYHHCANFSEDNELIKCLSDIFCRECEWD